MSKINNATKISETLAKKLADQKLTLSSWKANGKILKPLVKALGVIELEPTMDDAETLYVSATGDGKKLEQIVGILAAHGFSPLGEIGEPREWFSLKFTHPGTQVYVWLSFSASVCERIQVGTETITRPVYKTVCKGFGEQQALPAPVIDESVMN